MKKIISGIIFVVLIVMFIILGTQDYKVAKPADNELFSEEYQSIDEDNVYTYTNATKVLQTLKGGTGIIFFGFKSNVWAGYYANILNDVAKSSGVEQIYYYDFYEDRKNLNGTYESIVELLNDYITVLDDGTKNLYSPSVVIVKEGEIIAFNDDTAFMSGKDTPEEYWDETNIHNEKIKLSILIDQLLVPMEENKNE